MVTEQEYCTERIKRLTLILGTVPSIIYSRIQIPQLPLPCYCRGPAGHDLSYTVVFLQDPSRIVDYHTHIVGMEQERTGCKLDPDVW